MMMLLLLPVALATRRRHNIHPSIQPTNSFGHVLLKLAALQEACGSVYMDTVPGRLERRIRSLLSLLILSRRTYLL